MITVSNISVPIDADFTDLRAICAEAIGRSTEEIVSCKLLRRSVDARRKSDVHFVCTLAAEVKCDQDKIIRRHKNASEYRAVERQRIEHIRDKSGARPVVIGFGPAGMFAALTLAEAGYKPIVLERGRRVEQRTADVEKFWREHRLDPDSNVQFGEGGAGTFSDGKLNTGTKDARQREVLDSFVRFGAPESILYSAKPHIGTDKLATVVVNLRRRVNDLGGQVKFGCRLTELCISDGKIYAVKYICGGKESLIETDAVILAIGHSARDTFDMLNEIGVPMEQKPFAVGVRIEHHQKMIDRSQYGSFAGHPALGAADYRLSTHLSDARGVFSFCMCPGGTVVAAASECCSVVTNGMSNYARDRANANSALLVNVSGADFGSDDVMAGVEFQRTIERSAYKLTGSYRAPAQSVYDFMNDKNTVVFDDVKPSFTAGVQPARIADCLPSAVVDGLKFGLQHFGRMIDGFDRLGVLTAPETRSSSPVRIIRDGCCQSAVVGLFPCGEGAGYAGGIMSAAVDGIRCAEWVIAGGSE